MILKESAQLRNQVPASDWHRVGAGLSVRFTLRNEHQIDAEWLTRPPTRREKKRVFERYRQARDAYATEIHRRTGLRVMVLELLA